ncbi:unnamed protein product [Caenorhabditis angaria]|uniref:MSP domain-containing protein n=1 Tax=Caenorhabditis angaria TaxID=860376 RepID=A0A9P1I712_9PELO|nr:unnamed protein product [Caenorhabditis angaria]
MGVWVYIEPSSALFPATVQATSVHHLVNVKAKRLAFKVKTSNNEQYSVRPVFGFLDPNRYEKFEVQKMIGPPTEDKIIVQYIEVSDMIENPRTPFLPEYIDYRDIAHIKVE